MYERYRMGHLLFMGRTGAMPTAKVRRSLELFAKEVYPAVRHLGAESESPEDALPAAAPRYSREWRRRALKPGRSRCGAGR